MAAVFTFPGDVLPAELPPGVGAGKAAAMSAFILMAIAHADAAPAQARIGGNVPASSCVVVEIDGYRAGDLECVSQKLTDAARSAQQRGGNQASLGLPQAGSPDVEVGVASRSGASLRMGNALGHSVHPQRPSVSIPPPNMGPQP